LEGRSLLSSLFIIRALKNKITFYNTWSRFLLFIKKVQMMKKIYEGLTDRVLDRIIEMAWEDRTPFEAIEAQYGLSEKDVITLMRREMKASSFRMWRARVQGRNTKHQSLRVFDEGRHRCSRQRHISSNKISKR
jgi:uncharacterized protein (TIGR03643 family)